LAKFQSQLNDISERSQDLPVSEEMPLTFLH